MTKVRLHMGFAHPAHGAHQAGAIVSLPDAVAQELIHLKYAEAVEAEEKPEAAPDAEKVEKETTIKKPPSRKETTKKDPASVVEAEVKPEAEEKKAEEK